MRLVKAICDYETKTARDVIKPFKGIKTSIGNFLEKCSNDFEIRKQQAIEELTARKAIFVSQEAEKWGYSPDIDDDTLLEMLEDIYSSSGNIGHTLAELLCIDKPEISQQKLLSQIKSAILDGRIDIDVSEIFHSVQKCPGNNFVVLNQLLSLQDAMVRSAVKQARSIRSLDDELRKRSKILYQSIGDPITAMERTLSSFMSWKSFDEKKVLRFFKKYKGQLADFRRALAEVGLTPIVDPSDWVEQRVLPYDVDKHEGQVIRSYYIREGFTFPPRKRLKAADIQAVMA